MGGDKRHGFAVEAGGAENYAEGPVTLGLIYNTQRSPLFLVSLSPSPVYHLVRVYSPPKIV